MLSVIRKCGRLVANMGKKRWLAVIALGLVMSGVEAVGALLVYLLLGMVTGTEPPELPVLGDLEHLLPGWTDTSLFLLVAGLIGMFFVVRGALLIVQGYVESRVVENTGARLARRLVRGYLSLPYSMHVRRNSAKSIRNAFDTVQIMLHDGLLPMVRLVGEGLLVMGILVVLAITAPIATLLAVGVIGPMAVGLIRLVHPRLKALGQAGQRDTQASLQALQQSLHGMRDIILLGRERYFERVFTRSRTQLARTRYIRGTLKQVPRAAVETILVLTIVGFFAVTVLLDGSATGALPVLGLFGYAVMRLKPSLNTMMASVNSLRFADAAIEDLEEDLGLAESVKKEHRGGKESQPLTFERELALRDIMFRYDRSKEDALRGISLVIPRGASVGFVGPTGCGKSTLMDILSGLLEPTSGAVTVDGIDIHGRGKEWRRRLGVVPQSVFLVDDTLRRNIAFGLPDESIDEAALLQAVRMAQLDEFVASLPAALNTIVGEAGIRLSGGERQRVAIARALYRQPDVLIFDEGTSALDNRTEDRFLQVLKGLEGQRTMITVAHRLSTVRRCDTIFVMSGGSILDVGTFDELAERAAISVP